MGRTKIALTLPILLTTSASEALAKKSSIGIYPPLIRVRSNYNATVNVPVAVINESDTKQDLDIVLRPFKGSENNSYSISYYSSKDIPKNESDFIQTVTVLDDSKPVKSISLYPNETKNLTISFKSPSKTQDNYFSVIAMNKIAEGKSDDTLSQVASGVAANVLVSTGSKLESNGIITEFKAPAIVFSGPMRMSLVVTNTGDSYTTVSGTISVYDLLGNRAGQIPLKTTTILSGEARIMSPELPHGASSSIEWNEKFLLGLYTAKAVVSFDKTNSAVSETHFLGIPLLLLLMITLVLIVILNIIFRTLKKLNFSSQ